MQACELERWRRIEAALDVALDAGPDAAARALGALDLAPDERDQVERLLAHEGENEGPLERLARAISAAPEPGPELAGRRIGPWQLLEPLGEGGMATVWLARRVDGGFAQDVAIKCLKTGLYSPGLRRRFRQEQAILARLEHPNIARLFDGGVTDEGTPYIVMERVRGVPITQWCDLQRLTTAARLRVLLQALAAVAHAHRELVVHRDLKPGNILVDQSGQVKLLDFGVARLLDEGDTPAEATVLPALTPEYAAPEQLRGERAGTRADVYALGLVLYELVVGRRAPAQPQQREQRAPSSELTARRLDAGTLAAIAASRRRSPERLRRELRGDLDQIVLKALRERPDERYPGVDALIDDIERHLQRRPVLARPPGPARRIRLFLARHWLPVVAAGAVVAALTAGTVVSWQQASRADAQADRARSAQQDAEAALARAEAVNRFVVGLFQADIPNLPPDQLPTTRQIIDQGIAQARDPRAGPTDLRADYLVTLAGIVLARRQIDEAATLLDQAQALLSGSTDADPQVVARALLLGADIARQGKRIDDEEAALDRALDWLGRTLPDTPMHFEALRDRARLELARENLPAAEARMSALADQVRGRADLADLRLRLAGDLTVVHNRAGRLEQAREAMLEVLALKRADPDTVPVSLANTLHNLGSNAALLGRFRQSDDYYREALALLEPLVDTPLPTRAAALHGLASNRQRLGELEPALAWLAQSAEAWRLALQLERTEDDFFHDYHRGLWLAQAGRGGEALAPLRRALTLMTAGSEAPPARIVQAKAALAGALCDAGQVAPGLALWREASVATQAERDVAVADAGARCALRDGRPGDAAALLARAQADGDQAAPGLVGNRGARTMLQARALVAAGDGRAAGALAAAALADADRVPEAAGHPVFDQLRTLAGAAAAAPEGGDRAGD